LSVNLEIVIGSFGRVKTRPFNFAEQITEA